MARSNKGSGARRTAKRTAKHVDLIVANDVSRADAGFDVDTNEVTIIGPDGAEALPLQSKSRVAAALLDRVGTLLSSLWIAINSPNT